MSQTVRSQDLPEGTLISRFTIVILSTVLVAMDDAAWAPAWLADHASSVALFGLSCYLVLELVARWREREPRQTWE